MVEELTILPLNGGGLACGRGMQGGSPWAPQKQPAAQSQSSRNGRRHCFESSEGYASKSADCR